MVVSRRKVRLKLSRLVTDVRRTLSRTCDKGELRSAFATSALSDEASVLSTCAVSSTASRSARVLTALVSAATEGATEAEVVVEVAMGCGRPDMRTLRLHPTRVLANRRTTPQSRIL